MRSIRMLTLAALALAAAAVPARAQGYLTPFIGYNFGGDSGANCQTLTNCQEKHTNYGVALGSAGGVFGGEEEFGYAKNFFGEAPGTDNSVLTLMSNITINFPEGPIRPYAVGGIGLIRPHVALNTSVTTNNTLGYDLGFGVNGFFSTHGGIRADLRKFHTFQDVNLLIFTGQKLDFWRASLGLVLRF